MQPTPSTPARRAKRMTSPPSLATAPNIWVVAACFNEAAGIQAFIKAIESLGLVQQLLLIDDGSSDATAELVRAEIQARRHNPLALPISLIELTRNFGKEAAMLAGLDNALDRCDAVVLIDADLQHPVELIPAMVRHWQQGAEMVTAIRSAADQESTLKILSASGFYSLFNRLTDSVQLVDGAGDFRLLSQPVVRALTTMREGKRFSKALFPWTGFRSVDLRYDRHQRSSGASAWNLRRLVSYALDGIFSFSVLPLRIWIGVGTVISLISLLYALFLVIRTLVHGIDLPGYASLIVAVLFLGGVQLIGIGVLGEYIGRIFEESKRRPPYLIRRISASASR
jgi:glycosyltransferase involved in cell wall biosynthesis